MSDAGVIEIDGTALPVRIRRSARARGMSLRVTAGGGELVLVLPPGASARTGLGFVQDKAEWVRRRLAALPPRVPFAQGSVLPLLGVPHVLAHRPEGRRGVWAADGAIHVSGAAEHMARRVRDFLVARARHEALARAPEMAARLGRALGGVRIRDTRSRWGSCSAAGDLSLSWRLVLAPEAVFAYVVAHEVAHLAEMNHGPAFWRHVARLCPGHAEARAWLKAEGRRLHRYG